MSRPGTLTRRGRRRLLAVGLGSALLALAACGGTASPPSAGSASPSTAGSTEPSADATAAASPSATSASASPAASASASASAGASAGAGTVIEVTATEYAFDHPASIPAGATAIRVVNEGQEEHQAQFARINDDSTLEDVSAALLANDFAALFSAITLAGGPTGVLPGETGETGSVLTPGAYALICFITAPDGVPHLAKGMISQLEVTEPAGTADLPAGETDLTLQDFSFVGVETLPAGRQVVNVVNAGPQPHEAGVVRLSEGVTVQELIPMFTSNEPPSGPPPFVSAGGMAAIAPEATATMTLDLEPGEYAFLCFVPDPASGAPHVALGMITAFTVE